MSRPQDFWSRRKAAVLAEEDAERVALQTQARMEQQAELEHRSDPEILAELDLPDPDHLKPGDDIAGFMARAVPDRIRRRALRQLWRLNPVLANVDGLVDYGEDFTDTTRVVENIQTAYQVGKGMIAHIEAMASKETEMPDVDEVVETTIFDDVEPSPPALAAEPPAEVSDLGTEDRLSAAPPPRRMRFEFEG